MGTTRNKNNHLPVAPTAMLDIEYLTNYKHALREGLACGNSLMVALVSLLKKDMMKLEQTKQWHLNIV